MTAQTYNDAFFEAATGRQPPPRGPDNLADGLAGNSRPKGSGPSIDFKDTHLSADDHLIDPILMNDPEAFARRMDQATTDRLHPEAYGTGQADLDTATKDVYRGRDLSDVGAVAKTVEYKVNHWMNEAYSLREMAGQTTDPAARRQLLEQASAHMEEAQRQLTKQYGNMVLTRTQAMSALGNAPGARIPARLSEGINVLEKVKSGHLTPSQAEDVLRGMGTSTQQLAGQMSAYVEGLQKLRDLPSGTPKRPSVVMQGWRDEFRQGENENRHA